VPGQPKLFIASQKCPKLPLESIQLMAPLKQTGLCDADVSHYKENECMRLAMEEVLYNAGVDVVLNGHCHEYERSNPVYVSFRLAS